MDLFCQYMHNSNSSFLTIFVSNPPGPAILIWSCEDITKISGITVVESIEYSLSPTEYARIHDILKHFEMCNIPNLYIKYPMNMEYLIINGTNYDIHAGAHLISEKFGLPLATSFFTNVKPVNNLSKVTDSFHTWSRSTFDGIKVKKQDLDMVVLSEKDNRISCLFETKRSAAKKVGHWTPYPNDKNNYLQLMAVSDMLGTPFFTVHNDHPNTDTPLRNDSLVDVFSYKNNSGMSYDEYVNSTNRLILSCEKILKNLLNR